MPPDLKNISIPDEEILLRLFIGLFFLVLGIISLFYYRRLFSRWLKNEWLRRNLSIILVGEFFFLAIAPIYPDVQRMVYSFGYLFTLIVYPLIMAVVIFLMYNLSGYLFALKIFQTKNFALRQLWLVFIIIFSGCAVILPINFFSNGFSFKYTPLSILWIVFFGGLVGMFNVISNYIEYERKQRLNEKELELSKHGTRRFKSFTGSPEDNKNYYANYCFIKWCRKNRNR